MTDITITAATPVSDFDWRFALVYGERGRELSVEFDADKRSRCEIWDVERDEEVDFPPEQRDEILDRCALFVSFFDADALRRETRALVAEAIGAMEQHLAQMPEADPLGLHTAVRVTIESFGTPVGIVTALPGTNGLGPKIYEVAFWDDSSGEVPKKFTFHRDALIRLVEP